jgi:ribosome biogenesis protein ENP2
LFLVANEDHRIGTFFVPALDTAPKWCPFIENITEELEEENTNTIYDEYKFLS